MTALVAAETLLLGVVALFVIALLRSHAEILRRLEQLAPQAQLPQPDDRRVADERGTKDLEGATPDGGARRLVLAPGSDTLLAFLSSGCSTCVDLLEALHVDDLSLPPGLRLVVVAKDRRLERLRLFRPLIGRVEVLMSSAAWEQYRVPGSPYFLQIDGSSGSVMGEGSASSWGQVASLIVDAGDDRAAPDSVNRNRIDDTLAAAGIGPGHPSLRRTSPEGENGT
ncbi:MAG: hypothetical protein WAL31_02070 [Gaiellaceae bacterium]